MEQVEVKGKKHGPWAHKSPGEDQRVKVVVHLKQQGGFNEPAVLGFRFAGEEGYSLRIPIMPDVPVLDLPDQRVRVESWVKDEKEATVRVEIELPRQPTQITIDPDRVLLDSKPTNNHWKSEIRWRFTPLYTQLEEADVTNAYDRWNVIMGPWFYGSAYNDPWYTRSPLFGFKASVLSHSGTGRRRPLSPIAATTATSSPAPMRCGNMPCIPTCSTACPLNRV